MESYRLYDFNEINKILEDNSSDSDNRDEEYEDKKVFIIQMFGINEEGKTCSIIVENYEPFFYVKVPEEWKKKELAMFKKYLTKQMGKFYRNSITYCKFEKHKTLYGFDGGAEYNFILLKFKNIPAFNKAKNVWYETYTAKDGSRRKRLINGGSGILVDFDMVQLYEANIPPLLRLFHIKKISPSGWIGLPKNKIMENSMNNTTCDVEYFIHYENIVPLNEKEDLVPYIKASYDIEASSSHGDFPLPIKSYKKLASNIIDYCIKYKNDDLDANNVLEECVMSAFGYCKEVDLIERVYPKFKPTVEKIKQKIEQLCLLKTDTLEGEASEEYTIEMSFAKSKMVDEEDNYETAFNNVHSVKDKTISDLILSYGLKREFRINELTKAIDKLFPKLEGDKVTFIGTTFIRHGESRPYLNHCIVLNSCSQPRDVENCVIEKYDTEKEVLLAWQKLIMKQNPDIILGYNIFGFDYDFMYQRAVENRCVEQFLKLSKNKGEICGTKEHFSKKYKEYQINKSSIVIASGQHDLNYIKMNGRIQVDLYNHFRRDFNLSSYKLDYVSGYFIGDKAKKIEHSDGKTIVHSSNLAGLNVGAFIHFEESSHTTEYYKDGGKFMVTKIEKGRFEINSVEKPDMTKSVRWCLAKDDVTPQDIFRLTDEGPDERAIVAKYCIQDCNLVHELFNKIDIMTGFIEMATICSVPMSFLVLRGQGIKLTSFIAKKCRENGTVIPVIEKKNTDEGYEGAIVLEPKCGLYLDKPVACVDYSSLYPSSMISENLCHSSKVWTKEFDLNNELICDTGIKNEEGEYIYDNLEGYEYVDVRFDTYTYKRKSPKAAAQKIRCGHKICRYAQYPDDKKAILPNVLQELLTKRKQTKKLCAKETDPFMKNILDKRQLSIKLTANSLYGQTGAKTSTFYEPDVAASTTAVGRELLTYAKRVIEEVYGDLICETTKYGKVHSKAEYIYGDTDSVFFTFNLHDLDGNPITGKKALEITIELAQQAGELATKPLKKPHDLEYEKTFMPFCLLSKKRYVGILYETDPNKCKRKSMGIVLKRRDNAPIVKDVYGGIIDILMNEQNIDSAVQFLNDELQKIVDGKCPMDKLIISKSLRSHYKNPQQIAHKVLADRIGARDPGNKPRNGDRIPFVYVVNENKKALQGDRIETPEFIKNKKCKIDYAHYISNQIMKPLLQLFALILNDLPGFRNKPFKMKKFYANMELQTSELEGDKYNKKIEQLKDKEVQKLLFDKYLKSCENLKKGNVAINGFFKPKQ